MIKWISYVIFICEFRTLANISIRMWIKVCNYPFLSDYKISSWIYTDELTRLSDHIPPCYEMQRWMGGVKSSVYDSQLWTFSSSFSSHTIIQLNRINSYQDLVEVPLKVTILHRGWVCQHRQKGEHVNLVICLSLVSWFTGIWVCES